ncbi:diacylglycerol kinase family protein [Flavobacteriaceae bacterium]|nr:diacylglycerol kinase family protein [Flavobacteriaceae bacterium]
MIGPVLFVINPISGDEDKTEFLKSTYDKLNRLNIEFDSFTTTGKEDSEMLTSYLAKKNFDRILVLGGDGTILMAALAQNDKQIPIGIIPMGSANGLATDLGIPSDIYEALDQNLNTNYFKSIDLIQVNDQYYCAHIGDVGLNANLVNSYSKDENRGMKTYAKYFIEQFKNPKLFKVNIESSRYGSIEDEVYMVAICNSKKYGTGVSLNTIGNMSDGKFEIVLIRQVNFKGLIKAGLSIFDPEFINDPDHKVYSLDEAKISFPEKRLLQLDGEVIGKFKDLKIKCIHNALKICSLNDDK